MRGKKLLQVLLAAGASVIVGAFVVPRLSRADLEKVAHAFDARLLTLAFVCYLAANVLRALRFQLLVGARVSTLSFLRIIFVQNFMNTFLPLRAGELSYLYMVRRAGAVTLGHSFGSLVGARLLDLLAALLIPLSMSPLSRAFALPGHSIAWLMGLVAAVGVALALAIAQSGRIADHLSRRFAKRGAAPGPLVALLGDALRALGQLRERHVLSRAALLSLSAWCSIYASGYLLLRGAGVGLSVADCLFAYGFPTMVSMTPVYMFGGFGVYEGSMGTGLALVGVPLGAALATSLLLHVVELLFIVACGLFAPLLGLLPRPSESR